jgi:transketolase
MPHPGAASRARLWYAAGRRESDRPETETSPEMTFPIDLAAFRPLPLDPSRKSLSAAERATLEANIALCRDAIVFFTATAAAKGLGGHTGGPYDIVPEVLVADGFMRGTDYVLPYYFDEAGHRVAIQYLMAALAGHLPFEQLARYREAGSKLPGHPERGLTPGVAFSSGRLGHLWPFVNGVAFANPEKTVICFGSDGSQQEGNDAEAARMAVAHRLNVKIVVDDNDVTIAGHPSDYMPGYHVADTLAGHGIPVCAGEAEDLDDLYARMAKAVMTPGPVAVVNRRKMAVGIAGLEGSPHGHDVIPVDLAVAYLESRGQRKAVEFLKAIEKPKSVSRHRGSSDKMGSNRNLFGQVVVEILSKLTAQERRRRVVVLDSDLEGSCGLVHIRKAYPEIYVRSGIMERTNLSAAAGFGMEPGRQGIMGTFSAFLEMCVSEITMARLNHSNVLAHFSHAGCDDMADNTCHFGLNNFFAANGLEEGDTTRLYFPADGNQMRAVLFRIFDDPGLRFVFSTRSSVPTVLAEDGSERFGGSYRFEPDRDELIRDGSAGFVVSFGETLYRALDAVERLREKGLDVGLVNKPTLNVPDDAMLRKVGGTGFVLVAEGLNRATGLGVRYGTWLLERGLSPRYAHIGTHREGCGGLGEQMIHQGLDSDGIARSIEQLSR